MVVGSRGLEIENEMVERVWRGRKQEITINSRYVLGRNICHLVMSL